MKKTLGIGALVLGLSLVAVPVLAAEFKIHERLGYTLAQDATLSQDLYAAGERVSIEGAISGDATVAAKGTVEIAGKVSENLIAASGEKIDIRGEVGDVHAATDAMMIEGVVHGDVVAAAGSLLIKSGAVIEGDLIFFGGALTIEGEVKGEVHVFASSYTLSGSTGDSVIRADAITLSGATVLGNFAYQSGSEARIESSTITGATSRMPLPPSPTTGLRDILDGLNVGTLLMALVSTGLLIAFFRYPTAVLLSYATEHPIKTGLIGFAGLVATPLLSIIFLFTVVGLPLGLFLLFSYGSVLIAAKVFSGVLVGAVAAKIVVKEYRIDYIFGFVGVALVFASSYIPVVGWVIPSLSFVIMLGSVLWGIERMVVGQYQKAALNSGTMGA